MLMLLLMELVPLWFRVALPSGAQGLRQFLRMDERRLLSVLRRIPKASRTLHPRSEYSSFAREMLRFQMTWGDS